MALEEKVLKSGRKIGLGRVHCVGCGNPQDGRRPWSQVRDT